nr:MAG TPA: hypothetical protein [Caudoviricetes sp.]
MEKELEKINQKLDIIVSKREYPNSARDADDICEKLDIIIDLLRKKAE